MDCRFVLKCLYETYYDHDNSSSSRNGLRYHKGDLILITHKELVIGGCKWFANDETEGLGKIYHKHALIKANGARELLGEFGLLS